MTLLAVALIALAWVVVALVLASAFGRAASRDNPPLSPSTTHVTDRLRSTPPRRHA